MEVKPGHKQTEVGVIPEDWEVSPLEEFTSLISYGFTNPMPTAESGVYMITAKDINQGRIQFDTARCTTEEAYRTLLTAKSRPKNGDLLLTKDGTLGRVALVDQRTVCINQSVAILRPNSKAVPQFLKVLLEAPTYQNRMLEDAGGSTIKHIYITIVNRMPVALPPTKAEQEAIAGALSDADAFIDSLEQLLAKKRQLKQGAMQELLTGKKRLPGFGGAWALRTLVDLVKPEKFAIVDGPFGTQMKVEEYVSEGVPVIEMEHLNDGVITQRLVRFITPKKFEQLKRSAVYPGDIVISKTGSLGHLGVVPDSVERGIITSRLAKISLNPARTDEAFVFQYLLKLRAEGYWEKVSQGGTMQILGIRMLQDAPIPDISVTEQAAIAAILSDMDAEIAVLEAKLAKARQLKQGMMQELLSGRIRLV